MILDLEIWIPSIRNPIESLYFIPKIFKSIVKFQIYICLKIERRKTKISLLHSKYITEIYPLGAYLMIFVKSINLLILSKARLETAYVPIGLHVYIVKLTKKNYGD